MHQLAIVTLLRKLVSISDVPPLTEIVTKTEILSTIDLILSLLDDEEEYRFLRLEALWILINLLCAGEDETKYILASSFTDIKDIDEDRLNDDFTYGKSILLIRLDKMMKQIVS